MEFNEYFKLGIQIGLYIIETIEKTGLPKEQKIAMAYAALCYLMQQYDDILKNILDYYKEE